MEQSKVIGLHPIHWKAVFSKTYWLDFTLHLLGFSRDQSEYPEMYLFGLDFCLRTNPFIYITVLGFQFYFSRYNFAIYWPNGKALFALY